MLSSMSVHVSPMTSSTMIVSGELSMASDWVIVVSKHASICELVRLVHVSATVHDECAISGTAGGFDFFVLVVH